MEDSLFLLLFLIDSSPPFHHADDTLYTEPNEGPTPHPTALPYCWSPAPTPSYTSTPRYKGPRSGSTKRRVVIVMTPLQPDDDEDVVMMTEDEE